MLAARQLHEVGWADLVKIGALNGGLWLAQVSSNGYAAIPGAGIMPIRPVFSAADRMSPG
jgi:hypothetical protein